MRKQTRRHRIIATFFLLIFFPTLVPTNLFATNNGPNSFEAASFEPVDATDMVNLATGDMSYVLPLLNIPSPEGGYPLALSNHAGIAMDQEASWVGLGWGLNPGAINRNVNSYPDDVSGGKDFNFAFDQGQLEFQYLGIGVNINGISAGVGAYWGSNKTFGGNVSFGVGPISGSVGTGTFGTSVGLGYSGSVEDFVSNVSTGVSFKSLQHQGTNLSASGTGYSSSSFSFSQDDYNIQSSSKGFGVSYAGFNFYTGSTVLKYNLFKANTSIYNGILYPNRNNNSISSMTPSEIGNIPIEEERTHDTNKLVMYNDGVTNILDIADLNKNYLCDNVLLPNYDKYKVQAQGLSGTITPAFTEEIRLKHQAVVSHDIFQIREDEYYNDFKFYINNVGYFNFNHNDFKPFDLSMELNDKIFFEFENTNSSFLRIDRTSIIRDLDNEQKHPYQSSYNTSYRIASSAKTNKTSAFNESFTADSIALKNNNRKRVGKFVEAFTNAQILSGEANTGEIFLEAKNLNRSDSNTYRSESIGGYRITDVDGKVYHYSLPVINFEIWYKNFTDPNNEFNNFFERELKTPYATDWLLTAVTGPDYIDANNNNKVDSDDYGYWVEFDYGKWSDGYIWNGNNGKYDVVKGNVRNNDTYEYYKGRKQIYYLDAVRTRTHTAYFVKSLRQDAQGDKWEYYNSKIDNSGAFALNTHPKVFSSNRIGKFAQSSVSRSEKAVYNLPTDLLNVWISGHRQQYRYADFPTHYSLKLDKIILVQNNKLIIDKAYGLKLVNDKEARLYENSAFKVSSSAGEYDAGGWNNYVFVRDYFSNLKKIPIHQNENVIDIDDIKNLNINTNAEKIINFEYDSNYSLLPNSFHSAAATKGKLTLDAIEFLGKGGVKSIPKYKFKYYSPATPFNVDNEDGWGYHKSNPAAWSLSEITTPSGSKINFEYESDDYSAVAAKASRVFNKGMSFYITKNSTTSELFFEVTKNTDANDNIVEEFSSFEDFFKINESVDLDLFICRRSKYGNARREVSLDLNGISGQVISVSANSTIFKIQNSNNYWHFDDQDDGWILNRKFSLTSVKHANGSNDGVIMRDAGERNCWEWRSSYDNDDVNFHYKLASSTVPNHGKGGGIRVKQISITDGQNVINKSKYYYNKLGYDKNVSDTNYRTSGVTSFVPSKEFLILPYASELPSPVVMYSNVSLEQCNANNELISRNDYSFETLGDYQKSQGTLYGLGNYLVVEKKQNDHFEIPQNDPLIFSKHTIKNRINNLGRLISIKNYNSNSHLLYSLKNNYYTSNDEQDELGTKQESFISSFVINRSLEDRDLNANSVSKVWYPNKLESTSIIRGGLLSTTYFDKYDFLTGQVTETRTVSSDGQSYKTRVVPAYTKSQYNSSGGYSMGSKVDNPTNKNMLSQTAAEYSYIYDKGSTVWKETGVGITTWSNVWSYKDATGGTTEATAAKEKIWRKHKTFVWNGLKDNGIFMNYGANDDGFDWTVGVGLQPAQWKQTSETTLYNHYSVPLEMKDINGNFVSAKMDSKDSKIIVRGSARYGEIIYTGAEDDSQNPDITGPILNNAYYSHTGKKVFETTSSSDLIISMRNNEHRVGKYKLSVWVRMDGNEAKAQLKVNGNIVSFLADNIIAGNWQLRTAYINLPSSACEIRLNSIDSIQVYYDDLMIRPVASSITAYVYNEWDELWYVIGSNGLGTKYEYDAAGRLIKTYSEFVADIARNRYGGFLLMKSYTLNNKYLYQ